jgi:hypothetical protein
MSLFHQNILAGASGAGGASGPLYVDDVFSTYVYDGTSSTHQITNGIDLSGEGGLVWAKQRGPFSDAHYLYDSERNFTNPIRTNDSSGQLTRSTASISSFNSDGFTMSSDPTGDINNSGREYVSWTFRKAPGFFDVVTYTGNGTAGRTISHSLGSTPGMIMVKRLDTNGNWVCFHRSLGATKYLRLDTTNAALTHSARWNDTAPTSSVFTVGSAADVNANGSTYVAYLFAHDDQSFGTDSDEAIIKCGSYTGNTSTNPFIDLGFEPQWVMIKRTSNTDPWICFDNIRGIATGQFSRRLEFNNNNAEDIFGSLILHPNGFESSYDTGFQNSNGETYIYMAIRRPHKPPSAGTDVFAIDTQNGTSPSPPAYNSGFVTDFAIRKTLDAYSESLIVSRFQGVNLLRSNTSSESSNATICAWDYMNGFSELTTVDSDAFSYLFRRAPGFFDVVTFTSTGSSVNIPHNLTSTPSCIFLKARNATDDWLVYHSATGTGKALFLNSDSAVSTQANYWVNVTSTSFKSDFANNASGIEWIAFLFGTLNNISKVDSYAGTGNNIDVDCGFTAGARFVLIKRTDSTGDWYVFDSSRGIVSGNDPYHLLNLTDPQVTNTDYIDPLNSGFTVTSSAPAALNASGGTYMFIAIA